MKTEEYEKELKVLYEKAIKLDNIALAFELLERGRAIGLENINKE